MAEFPALPLWTDALIADTDHLSHEEFGLYLRILIVMWRAPNQRIPDDNVWLKRRFKAEIPNIRKILEEFCAAAMPGWQMQKRLTKEWDHVKKRSVLQTQKAKARWNKEKDICRGNAARHASGIAPLPLYNGRDRDNGNVRDTVKNVSKIMKVNGVNYNSEENRIQYAIQKALEFLPGRDQEERWRIAQAAEDINHPRHAEAVSMMLVATKQARVGWVSPERRKKP